MMKFFFYYKSNLLLSNLSCPCFINLFFENYERRNSLTQCRSDIIIFPKNRHRSVLFSLFRLQSGYFSTEERTRRILTFITNPLDRYRKGAIDQCFMIEKKTQLYFCSLVVKILIFFTQSKPTRSDKIKVVKTQET